MKNLLEPEYLERVCCGNVEAMEFVRMWARYAHEVDDIIDGDRVEAEEILSTFALAILLYSHPFYLRNMVHLRAVLLNITSMYADTVQWERGDVGWKAVVADALRCCGNEVTFAVAMICGGYDHVRTISAKHRELCWRNQHAPEEKRFTDAVEAEHRPRHVPTNNGKA